MNPQQIEELLKLLGRIADGLSKQQMYTLTGAADWPILLVVGGVMLGMIGFMWRDLGNKIESHRKDWKEALAAHIALDDKDHQLLWKAHRECQEDCCKDKKS